MRIKEPDVKACTDCGAEFPPCPAGGGGSGYAVTAVPRISGARLRYTPQGESFPAFYDVEGEQAAHDAGTVLPYRRICYPCSAILERETMTARGRGCLYLCQNETPTGRYLRQAMKGPVRFDYVLSGWPGVPAFRILGLVNRSTGYGFGGSFKVETFSFIGPDGYVWSGRCAGDMQLARCRRTRCRYVPGKGAVAPKRKRAVSQ